jgi:Tfp pilus assembly protein PilF
MRVNSAPTKQPTRSETKTIESALLRAEEHYHQREFAKSLAVLDGLSVPSRFPLLQARRSHDRGIALLRLEKKVEAFESLSESLRLDTKNVEAACLLSEIALSKKDYVTARLYAERALAIDARSTFAGALRAQIERSSVDRGKASKP